MASELSEAQIHTRISKLMNGEPFKLSTEGNIQALGFIDTTTAKKNQTALLKKLDIVQFVKKGIDTSLTYGKHKAYFMGNFRIICVNENGILTVYGQYGDEWLQEGAVAVVAPDAPHIPRNNKYAHVVLLDGDEDVDHFRLTDALPVMPTVSFECLANLANPEAKPMDIHAEVAKGNIRLLDYTLDTRLPLRKTDKEKLQSQSSDTSIVLKAPKPGFSLIGSGYWHRAASTLFYNTKRDETYLLGQDEDTYFGCCLADNVQTIQDAFVSLQPPEARGKKFLRQGEWFVIPIEKTEWPLDHEFDFFSFEYGGPDLILPIDDPDSNLHTVSLYHDWGIKDKTLYAQHGSLTHAEHDTVSFKGHYKILKNTAIRSVSVDGVD